MNCSLNIGFYAALAGAGTNMGYGYTAVELIEAWQRQQIPVWWENEEAPIAFSFVQPHGYEYQNQDRLNIGYTPWESTGVPQAWLFYMEKMDEIWTTSNACKEWYQNAGLTKPVRVLHHGINRDHWPLAKRTKKENEPFRFLHIGSGAQRKGGRTAYDAFVALFGNNHDYILVLKGKPDWEIEYDNVYVISETLPQQELLKLYHKCHCFLYPSQGEGFGLLPFQAAATGMPSLVTDWGGPQDFMQHCWPIKVADIIECNYEPHEGTWALPDIDDLCESIITIADNYKDYSQKAFDKGYKMDKEWSWDSLAVKSLNWMRNNSKLSLD